MAKKITKTKAKAKAKDTKETKTTEHVFGVEALAEALELKPASVRVKLREAGVDKNGKSYGWSSKKEFDTVVKQLKKAA